MSWSLITFILGSIFLVIVVPLYIIFSFIERIKSKKVVTQEDELVLNDLWKMTKDMDERINTLETIMNQNYKKD